MKQKWTALKGERDISRVTVGDISTPLARMQRTIRQKIIKETED